MDKPRICIVPEFPVSLMTGGTLVQATETRRALAAHVPEMHFDLFNWSEVETPADCYHFIGLPHYLAGLCSLISRSKRPYVLTLLMGSERASGLRAAAWRRRVATWTGRSREHQNAIENASAFISLTSTDARAISTIYGIAPERIHLVPVAVSESFFDAKPDLWVRQYGAAPFVLCVGAIQRRKNQLLLARICNDLGLPLVLVGRVLHGQSAYAEEVQRAMEDNEKAGGRWLRCDDALLASAYAACKVFALLSASETQPASVLQAMALNKPVLLADAPYVLEQPFDGLPRADWRDDGDVKNALRKIWAEATPTRLSAQFTWPTVCGTLRSIYASAMAR